MEKPRWIALLTLVASCTFFLGRASSQTVASVRAGSPTPSDRCPPAEAAGRTRERAPLASQQDVRHSLAKAIAVTGPRTRAVDSAAFETMLGNLATVSRSARVIPEARDGEAHGFRLRSVRPEGALSLLGFQNGDLVTAINGLPLASPEKALVLYQTLRTATHLSVDLERDGQRITQEYDIH